MASETLVTDISSLSGCPGLQSLDLRWTQVTDISVLSVCSSLDGLLLKDCTGITDFSVPRNLTTLTQLDVGGTAFSQFSLLEGMPQLGDLCIASTLHPTAIDCRELLTLQLPALYRLYVNADDETYAQLTAYFPDCEIFNSSMPEK